MTAGATVPERRPPRRRTPSQELERLLRRDLDGEVAFDDYTRHLFSRDASMYAITPARRRVPPARRRRRRGRRGGGIARRPRRRRAAPAPAWPARPSAPAWCSTCPGTWTGSIELDPRRAPRSSTSAWCRTSSTARPAPHGLMFGPDTSTSNRATIGGMIGNNSAGSGSAALRHDHRPRAGARRRALRRVAGAPSSRSTRPSVTPARGRGHPGGPPLPRAARHRRAAPRAPSRNDFPAFWRRAGGYRLDRLADETPFDLAKFVVGSEGTLAVATAGAGRPGAEAASHGVRGRPLRRRCRRRSTRPTTRCPATPRRSR